MTAMERAVLLERQQVFLVLQKHDGLARRSQRQFLVSRLMNCLDGVRHIDQRTLEQAQPEFWLENRAAPRDPPSCLGHLPSRTQAIMSSMKPDS